VISDEPMDGSLSVCFCSSGVIDMGSDFVGFYWTARNWLRGARVPFGVPLHICLWEKV
jgi:hypothetical protein